MDLVSTTLDKYLRHRFNGTGMEKLNQAGTASENEENNSDTTCTSNGAKNGYINRVAQDDGEDEHDSETSTFVHHLSIRKLRPICTALSENSHYLAIGFESSQIYLWKLSLNQASAEEQSQNISSNARQSIDRRETSVINPSAASAPTSSLQIGDRYRLLAHSGPVYFIEFVKNNDLMISCSEDTTIRLWCLNTKCNLATYRGHNYPVWSLAIGPSGEYFASTSMDATARLWRFDKITPLRIFCGHDGDVECASFHPNSKYIATGSSDTTVRLWSTSDGKMVRMMIGHQHPISSLSFLPDGKFLASADTEGSIKIWNLATNNVVNSISAPASRNVSFNSKQNFISTCGIDNVLRLWKIGKSNINEKKRLDFNNNQRIRLVSSLFFKDKLFVISFIDDEKHQASEKMTMADITEL